MLLLLAACFAEAPPPQPELQQRPWSTDTDRGFTWIARFPADARLSVYPAADVTPIAEIHAPAPGEVVVNGGFYDAGPMGLVRHLGREVAPLTPIGGSGIASWAPGQPVRIVHRDAWDGVADEAVQSIDRLVSRGRSLVSPQVDGRRAARVALITTADGPALVLTAAGQPDAAGQLPAGEDRGPTLGEFAALLVTLGAQEALNLDGGISAAFDANLDGRRWTADAGGGTMQAVVLSAR